MLSTSCSRLEGWGLVLWAPEASGIDQGAVLAVEFKSNISQTWIVQVPGSEERQEVELWRLSVYDNKRQAQEAAEAFAELAWIFAASRRDGLVLREKPEIAADQVYRLRLDEPIKLLRKVSGARVETGGQELEGAWYSALTSDGTSGYVYSNQLTLWDASREDRPALTSDKPAVDARMMDIFDVTWRPEYFSSMEASGKVDLSRYQTRFGIFTDPSRKQLRVELPWFSKAYNYNNIEQAADGSFILQPMGAVIYFSQRGDLVFTPPESDISAAVRRAFQAQTAPLPATLATTTADSNDAATTPAAGSTTAASGGTSATEADPAIRFTFRRQTSDPRSIIATEERRRLNVLANFVASGEYFESLYNGVLVITPTGRFTWMNYETLVPSVIAEGMGDKGEVAMDLFIHPEMAGTWQGAFTLRFDTDRRKPVSFVYRSDQNSLTLVPVPAADIQQATVLRADAEKAIFFMRY
ncbi:MAG: SH3 domain-containing protein [Spirochaetes bacterium]|nr:SH3 domain-containing protein [Spirochaetota bacterium]